jgi:hypothetical protein
MCTFALCAVDDLKQHRVGDVKLRKLVEGRGGHEELATMVCLLALRSGHHGDRIAAVVFIEAARPATSRPLLHGSLVHVGVSLVEVVRLVWMLVWYYVWKKGDSPSSQMYGCSRRMRDGVWSCKVTRLHVPGGVRVDDGASCVGYR